VSEGNWGYSQLYYQYNDQRFKRDLTLAALDRDGTRHSVGFNQFLFPEGLLPEFIPITYFRIGALGDFLNTEGSEFDYNSWEFSFGFGMELPFELALSVLYRLSDRDFENDSIFSGIPPALHERDDLRNRLNFELTRAIGDHWQISTAGSFSFNDSDVGLYDHNRHVIGAYLTYRF
jgi:hypothetical protein